MKTLMFLSLLLTTLYLAKCSIKEDTKATIKSSYIDLKLLMTFERPLTFSFLGTMAKHVMAVLQDGSALVKQDKQPVSCQLLYNQFFDCPLQLQYDALTEPSIQLCGQQFSKLLHVLANKSELLALDKKSSGIQVRQRSNFRALTRNIADVRLMESKLAQAMLTDEECTRTISNLISFLIPPFQNEMLISYLTVNVIKDIVSLIGRIEIEKHYEHKVNLIKVMRKIDSVDSERMKWVAAIPSKPLSFLGLFKNTLDALDRQKDYKSFEVLLFLILEHFDDISNVSSMKKSTGSSQVLPIRRVFSSIIDLIIQMAQLHITYEEYDSQYQKSDYEALINALRQ